MLQTAKPFQVIPFTTPVSNPLPAAFVLAVGCTVLFYASWEILAFEFFFGVLMSPTGLVLTPACSSSLMSFRHASRSTGGQ
jgi:hypothetical protein